MTFRSDAMPNMKSGHVVALACVIGATIVAASGNSGWGWLLFIAFCAL